MSPSAIAVQRHALIIDDNPSTVEVLTALLRMEGVRATAFLRPDRALEALPTLRPVDVVFCDIEMPHVSGFDLLPELKRILGNAVPIIAYTVHTSEIELARRYGFSGFLGKPVDGEQFSAHLSRILAGLPVWEIS